MKILYVYPTPRGDIYSKKLSNKGPDDFLYGINYMSKFNVEADFSDKGFNKSWYSHFLKIATLISYKNTNVFLNAAPVIRLYSTLNKYDIIFTTADSCGLPFAMLKYFGLLKKPIVYSSIGLTERLKNQDNIICSFYKKILKSVDKILYYGYQEGIDFIQLLKMPKYRLKFIPFGVDIDYFNPSKEKQEDFILSVGSDQSRDFNILFRVVEKIGVRTVVVTSPERVHRLNIPRNVQVLYNIPIYKLKDYYAKSKFVVIPVHENSYSAGTMVLLESMSMAKAVIVSYTKAVRNGYELKHGDNCILVEPASINELEKAIKYLLVNQEEINRIGINARKTVEKKYSTKTFAENLVNVFNEIYS